MSYSWDPMYCSPPGSSVRGIFQARIQEWGAISFSRDLPGLGRPRDWTESPALQADSLLLSHQGSPILQFSSAHSIQFSSVQSLSRVQLFATSWTVAYQAPLSMEFSRQGYWSRLPFPSPGDFPNPGIQPRSPALYHLRHLGSPPIHSVCVIPMCLYTHL